MNPERLIKIIHSPHLSEKASRITEQHGQYAFRVDKDATKLEIKQAIEYLFNVNVVAVNTLNIKPTTKRFGQTEGQTKAWKKAYVTLKEGQKIDFIAD